MPEHPARISREIYLDNNATTRPLPDVVSVMTETMELCWGNPGSIHSAGARAQEVLRRARRQVAELLGCPAESLIFTSGATEGNNMVLASATRGYAAARIVTTQVEHPSILRTCEHLESLGVDVCYLPVDRKGLVDPVAVKSALSPATALVSIQWVSNETGVIQPIEEIGAICREAGIAFHTDAAQAVGKIPLEVEAIPVDYLTLSGHKFHAPSGVGAVFFKHVHGLVPFIVGGEQELGLRAGTENLAGIAALGKAAELRHASLPALIHGLATVRNAFEGRVFDLLADARVNGDTNRRVCNTTNILFPGIDGEALVARLDQRGVRCSQSSACTNHRPEPSSVLRAMGLTEDEAYASVRFAFSPWETEDDALEAAEIVADIVRDLRQFWIAAASG